MGKKGFSRRMSRRRGDRDVKGLNPLYTDMKLSMTKSINRSQSTHVGRGRRKGFNSSVLLLVMYFVLIWVGLLKMSGVRVSVGAM